MSVCLPAHVALGDDNGLALYQHALTLVHAGDKVNALAELEQLIHQYPEVGRYRYDYIQMLSWTNQDREVLQQIANINTKIAPVYVLEAIAKSARNIKDFQLAEKLYRHAIATDSVRLESKLGLALTMIDQKQADLAITLLSGLAQSYPKHIDILMALASAYELKKQFLVAIMFYEDILVIQPRHKEVIRRLTFDLQAAGAIRLAYEKAALNRALFSDDEWARFKWDGAAALIRWGETTPLEGTHRFDEIDVAIQALENNLLAVNQLKLKESSLWLARVRIDYIIALRNRVRMQDVLDQYHLLLKQNVSIPVYGLSAITDAYLYLEQPEQARDFYIAILKERPRDFETKIALVYAYLEAEQFDDAVKLTKHLIKEQPDKRHFKNANGSGYTRGNPKKTRVERLSAILNAYADQLDQAVVKLEDLHDRSSFNPDIRSDLAKAYLFRGWLRKSIRYFDISLNLAPKHLDLKIGYAQALQQLKSYREAEKVILKLALEYPEHKGVQKQKRLWDIHNGWEFKSLNQAGLSRNPLSSTNNNPKGSEYIGLDNYWYSPPIEYNYRFFVHQSWSSGLFPGQQRLDQASVQNLQAYLQTYGFGVAYAARGISASSEIYDDIYTKNSLGVNLELNYEFDDHWLVSAGYTSLDNHISLKAFANGITASTGHLQLTYRAHESRHFDLATQFTHYSAGDDQLEPQYHFSSNNHVAFSGNYTERWYSNIRYKLATDLRAGYSANSSTNVPYFNPTSDAFASLTLDQDYLTYRHYDTEFHQRLLLAVGNYWQAGYGSNVTANIQYEHRWKAQERFELTYGANRVCTAYDGVPTESWVFYLNTSVRF